MANEQSEYYRAWNNPEEVVQVKTWDKKIVSIKLKDLPELLKKQRQEQIDAGVWKGDK